MASRRNHPAGGAAAARRMAGLTVQEAARKLRVSPAYLTQVERQGAPYALARRLAALYGCSIGEFLYPGGSGTLDPR